MAEAMGKHRPRQQSKGLCAWSLAKWRPGDRERGVASRAGRGRDSTQEAWLCRASHGHPRIGEVLSRCAHGSKGTVGLIHVHLVPMCVPGPGRGGTASPRAGRKRVAVWEETVR